MTDHAWATEQIAAFLADGLDAGDADRFRTHLRDCGECVTALEAARAFDNGLANLFAAVRPGPLLEDRTVRALRTPKTLPTPRRPWGRRVLAGLAATLLIGAIGAGGSYLAANGGLPMPGEVRGNSARTYREVLLMNDSAAVNLTSANQVLVPKLSDSTSVDRSWAVAGDGRISEKFGESPTVMFGRSTTPPSNTHDFDFSKKTAERFRGDVDESRAKVVGKPVTTGINQNGIAAFNPQDNFGFTTNDAGKDGKAKALGALFDQVAIPTPALKQLAVPAPAPQVAVQTPALESKSRSVVDLNFTPAVTEPYFHLPPVAAQAAIAAQPKVDAPPPAADPVRRIILRSGDIEFEVDAFDPAVAAVTQLVAKINGGYVGTVNSEKLANGKVKGSVVVRVPPESLDGLVLDLRRELGKAGELKGQKIGSADVTKQYTDLESRLKAARAMETRLLAIIKDGKGEIKQLLEAEKELGVWRTKIEEHEGELRCFANLAALSTLTITLAEKEIRVAAGVTETEVVQAGVEVEDVDKAFRDAIAAVAEAKGRVTKSELKQLAAGQFNALVNFEVSPEQSGPMRDRLKQLGRVARLQIDRVQTADGGPPVKDAKVKRGDAAFQVQFYNLANIEPRETATVQVAATDVAAAFRVLRDAVERAKGRVVSAEVSEGDRPNVTAQFVFQVKRSEEADVIAALASAGEIVSRTVTRAAESDAVTDTKLAFRVALFDAAKLRPRETTTLAVEVADVEATAAVLKEQVASAGGRVADSQVSHDRGGQTKAKLAFDVPLAAATGVVERAKAVGTVRVQQSSRDPAATDGKLATARVNVTLTNVDPIVSQENGVGPQVRKGLTTSATALLASLSWVVVGLCVVLPWMVVAWLGYRLVRRLTRKPSVTG